MIEIGQNPARRLLTIRISGDPSAADYEAANTELEEAFASAHGPLNAVIELDQRRGWDLDKLWKALKLDLHHFNDFRRIAVVGQTDAGAVATAGSLLSSAQTKSFSFDEIDAANEWAAG